MHRHLGDFHVYFSGLSSSDFRFFNDEESLHDNARLFQ